MQPFKRLKDYENLKILADARRLAILRLLMAEPATLSQLGKILDEHPAKIRHHLVRLEEAGLVEMVGTRVVRGFIEKYYRAGARAYLLNEVILPYSPDRRYVTALGSHDIALELLGEHLRQKHHSPVELLVLPVGSLEGLIALRQGASQLAGCHLLDAETGEYNLPYIRHFFPEGDVTLITLAHRQQGLIVSKGNPRKIRSLDALGRHDLRLINRNPGSGTRLWLDRQLGKRGLLPGTILGYANQVRTHTEVAQAVRAGKADLGVGLQAAARQYDLDFIPLFQERFDLVIHRDQLEDDLLTPLLDYLESGSFRHIVGSLPGYDSSHTGDQFNP